MKLTVHTRTVPDGTYLARIMSLEEKVMSNGLSVRILTRIESPDPEVNGLLVSTLVDMDLGPKNRLGRWVMAALGFELADGMEIELTEMLQQVVQIQVENKPNKAGEVHPNIVAVWPAE